MLLPPLIPQPTELRSTGGSLSLGTTATVSFVGFPTSATAEQKWIQGAASDALGRPIKTTNSGQPTLSLMWTQGLATDEAYRLEVGAKGITVESGGFRGFLWAMQTLRQLRSGSSLPWVQISDAPTYRWRGVMVDEGRHFIGEQALKRLLDQMARMKLNTLHWHLTEDQGWRIEIKKYPKLTQVGSRRVETDGTIHQGFYTQTQIRRIVRYAESKGIDIVPEIELPGHCNAALACYPELGCRKAHLPITPTWGVYMDVYCAGRDTTFQFLEGVLDEVCGLFPSKVIHIGGDEVPKDRWTSCPDCQRRISEEHLQDTKGLQSYFVKRIQKYLAKKGRTLMGWDEIMEGGLAKGAIVQIWNDQKLALPATAHGNPVVLSQSSGLYLNRSADVLNMETVYNQSLLPTGMNEDQKSLVLGIESPLWSERITRDNLIARFLPRGWAVAELAWADPKKNYQEFIDRARVYGDQLRQEGVEIGPEDKPILACRIQALDKSHIRVTADCGVQGAECRYEPGDKEPTTTSQQMSGQIVLPVGSSGKIKPFFQGKPVSVSWVFNSVRHLANGCDVKLTVPPHPKYAGEGAATLCDGLVGSDSFADGSWLGWQGTDVVATIDLGTVHEVNTIGIHCLQQMRSWILYPSSVRFETSTNGVDWHSLDTARAPSPIEDDRFLTAWITTKTNKPTQARFVRITATNPGKLPAWHLGAGGESFIFADEIRVD